MYQTFIKFGSICNFTKAKSILTLLINIANNFVRGNYVINKQIPLSTSFIYIYIFYTSQRKCQHIKFICKLCIS